MTSNISDPHSLKTLQPAEIHLHDYLRVIIRRRKTFVLVFLAVFLGVAAYTFTTKPVYEATAALHVKEDKGKVDLLGALGVSQQEPVETEIEILKSRSNAEQVVKRLHLDWQVTNKSKGTDFQLLEFSSQAVNSPYEVELTGQDSYVVRDSDGHYVGTGRSGVLLQAKGLRLFITHLRGKPRDVFEIVVLPFNATVENLRQQLKAIEVAKKTNIMSISYTNTNRVLARDVVNTLVQAYLQQNIGFKTQEASRTVDFVDEQMKGLTAGLDTAEKNLQVFKSSSGVVQLDPVTQAAIQQIADTEKGRSETLLFKKQVEFAIAALKDAMKQGKLYTPSIMKDDPGVAILAAKLADLEVQKRALLVDNTESHPQVRSAQAQIGEVQNKLLAIYETAQKNLVKAEALFTQQLRGYEGKLRQLPEAERELAGLTRFAKVNADVYTLLLQKREDARIAKASTISNIDIVDPAIITDRPVKPKKLMNLLLGLLAGLLSGVGLAFFQEYLDDTIKDSEEAKRVLGIPLLALIPQISPTDYPSGAEPGLIPYIEPKSQVAEAFRSLRTSIHFSALSREKKVFVITSTFPGEGKTTVVANLGITLAQTGARVLVLDCDLRRPSLHVKFGHSKEPGLTELLAGDTSLDATIHDTTILGLDFVSAGTTPPNPAELLGSEEMRKFIQSVQQAYDYVLLDAPPVLAVTDAPLLTALADLVLVVLEAGRVPAKAARRMKETLATVQAPVAGLVINDKTGRGETYGYYGYRYYGGYGYYGDQPKIPNGRKPLWNRLIGSENKR